MNNTEKIIQISSGKGPAECCWVVSQLLKVFIIEAKAQNILVKTISRVKGEENRTLNSVTLLVKGNNTDSFLIDWLGTIQWVGKSMFRKYHKRKNWFIGVSEFKTTKKINWNEKDIRFETFRSSGAGGQHVNKVESAVRAIHIPTGTSSTARDSRSQYQNKKIVIERLREVLEKNQFNTINNELNMQWMGHNTLERGNPIRIYTGEHFKRKN